MIDPILATYALDFIKIWVPTGTFLFGCFKAWQWVKAKFVNIDKNVIDMKTALDTNINGLREDTKHQTATIATALSEQRQDFRTFYAPTLLMMQQLQQPPQLQAKPKRKKPAPLAAKPKPKKKKAAKA